jgi:hypothetical protein
MLNVGWLGSSAQFPVGDLPGDLLGVVLQEASRHHSAMAGFHECDFCGRRSPIVASIPGGPEGVVLGMSELRAMDDAGHVYAAPTLIFHYIKAHGYLPPEGFVRALRQEYEWGRRAVSKDSSASTIDISIATRSAGSTVSRIEEVVASARGAAREISEIALPEEVSSHFPGWFVEACSPGRSVDFMSGRRWRELDADGRAAFRAEPWEISDWWEAFRPGRSGWAWGDARVTGSRSATIRLRRTLWTAQLGALEWLVRAAGGQVLSQRSVPTVGSA